MSLLEIQLTEFRRVQQGAANARLELMKEQKATIVGVKTAAQLNVAAVKSAGDTLLSL